jgi:hypothetical protein
MRRRAIGLALVTLLPLPALAAPAGAQDTQRPSDTRYGVRPPYMQRGDSEGWRGSAAEVCRRPLEDRIRSEHPHTDAVEITPRSLLEWSYSRAETALSGEGRMLRGKTWDEFDFVCLVESRSGRLVALEWSGPLHDGQPVRPGAQRPERLLAPLEVGSPLGRACADAVGAEIRREHPRSGRVDLERESLRQWRRSQAEAGALGEGRFAGARGRPHPFEFSCVWDARRGGVTSVYYELQ